MSNSTLITFADDVAVVATGHTITLLEEAMNQTLDLVSIWMKDGSYAFCRQNGSNHVDH